MNRLKEHLRKHYLVYLIWTVLAFAIISWEFSMLTATKENEKVDLFICCEQVDNNALNELFDANKPSYLKEINYRTTRKDDELYGQLLMTYGAVDADMYIMPESALKDLPLTQYFYRFDIDTCNELFNLELTYYASLDGKAFGIAINNELFTSQDENMYLLFANDSLHLGKLNDSNLDGAIEIAKLFIK